jgi:hypothetical protein
VLPGRWLKCSLLWTEIFEPSEPLPLRLKVNPLLTVFPFWLKLPQAVNLPV